MSAFLTSRKLSIRDTSVDATVPNNPKARLMYYINCVASVIKAPQLERYRNYQQYYNIPDSEIDDILEIAKLFNPKVLVEIGIFILEENMDRDNRFLEITNEEMGIHVNDEIFIGGVKVRVSKLMVFKKVWVMRNYLEPYESLTRRDQNVVIQSYRDTNFVYYRRQDPLEECLDCKCDCKIF